MEPYHRPRARASALQWSVASVRLPKIVAVAWVFVALGLTVLVGPELGLRGWFWLGVHHALCAFGVAWELWVRAGR